MESGEPAQGHVVCGQEGLAPRLLNPGPHASPLSAVQSKALAQIATHACFLLLDLVGGFGVAWGRATEAQLKSGRGCRVAEEGLPEAETETKAFEAFGDRSVPFFSGNSWTSFIPQPLPARELVLSVCPSVSTSAPTLRAPLSREGIGLVPFCLCRLCLQLACIPSDIIDGMAS